MYSAVVLARTDEPAYVAGFHAGVLGHAANMFSFWKSVYTAPRPSPQNTRLAKEPPLSPAKSTSPQAVPSGYWRFPCSLTMSWRRNGIMKNTPSHPPIRARRKMRQYSRSKPRKIRAGKVKITPPATDSQADVDGYRPEDDPEDHPQDDGPRRELGEDAGVGDVGLERDRARRSSLLLGHTLPPWGGSGDRNALAAGMVPDLTPGRDG